MDLTKLKVTKMKLVFKSKEDSHSQAEWNNIVVLLSTGAVGEVDVMFTGYSEEGCIISKVVEGTAEESDGFLITDSLPKPIGFFKYSSEYFCMGELKNYAYFARYAQRSLGNLNLPQISGKFYIGVKGGKNTCIGVDDPSMLNRFIHLNPEYSEFVSLYGFKVGDTVLVKEYSKTIEATVVDVESPLYAEVKDKEGNKFHISVADIVV